MENFYKSPEFWQIPNTHLQPLPRRFNAAPRVQTIGYIPAKVQQHNQYFSSLNYSFILSGTGFYYYRGKRLEVTAPCVITQWPGEIMHYGPEPEWEELYFIYDARKRPDLEKAGLVTDNEALWYLESGALLREKFIELGRLLQRVSEPFISDRIDHLCLSIIMESRMARVPSPLEPGERVIRQIESHVRRDVSSYYDFGLIARKYGLHPAKFRRDWNRFIGTPPAKYLMNLRMAEAGRLLVETSLQIGEVARQLGFNDELYFSKKFRTAYGTTASAYRKYHQENLSLKPGVNK